MGKRFTVMSRSGEAIDVTAAVMTYARPPRDASPWVRGYRMGIVECVETFAGHAGVDVFYRHVEAVMNTMKERYNGD